ncbi:TPA: hypothetical protein LVL19_003597 [Klebsiella michiganensis]|nr:hypothetical protein [Klebsiella michiganensis]
MRKLELTPRKRRRLLLRIARHGIIAAAKRNQRRQQSPDGTPWPARKGGKGKLLPKLPKLLAVREVPEQEKVVIYLRGDGRRGLPPGALGHIHAQGMTTTINAGNLRARSAQGVATKAQARALRKLGHKHRRDGRLVKSSAAWIEANLDAAQAGLLIRKLSGQPVHTTWRIELPAREFLGVDDDEFARILARQLQGLNYG